MSMFYYPNRMGQIILRSMQEVLGVQQYHAVLETASLGHYAQKLPPGDLELAFAFEEVAALQIAVESTYGLEEGHKLNHRIGKMCLYQGLQDFNPLLGIADLPQRAMPLTLKLHIGFDMFSMVFNRFTDQIVKVSEGPDHYLWIIQRCPVCWGRHSDVPCCQLAVGIIDEALTWVTGGRHFTLEQTTCVAMGHDDCTIRINKRPNA